MGDPSYPNFAGSHIDQQQIRLIDETNDHEEETVQRVDNFQNLPDGSGANFSDQHAMDFNTNYADKKNDPVCFPSLLTQLQRQSVPYIRREDDDKNYEEERHRSSTKMLKDRNTKVQVVGKSDNGEENSGGMLN